MKVFNATNAMPEIGANQAVPQLTFSSSVQRVIINQKAGELIDAKVGGNVILLQDNGKVFISTKKAQDGMPLVGFQKGTTAFRLSVKVMKELKILKAEETGCRVQLKEIPTSLGTGEFVDCYQLIL